MLKPNTLTILTTNRKFPTNNHLFNAFSELGYQVNFINPYEFDLHMQGDHIEPPQAIINRCGGLYFDDHDLLMAQKFEDEGSYVLNSPKNVMTFRNKDSQILELAKLTLPTVPTITSRSGKISSEDFIKLEAALSGLENTQRYIVKNIRGQGGKGVIRVFSRETLNDLIETRKLMNDSRLIIQPFFPLESEYRVYFVDDSPIAALTKNARHQDQKLNLAGSQFQDIELEKLPEQVHSHFSILASIPLNFYSVDFIQTSKELDSQCFLLEINTFPGMDGLVDKSKLVAAIDLSIRNHKQNS